MYQREQWRATSFFYANPRRLHGKAVIKVENGGFSMRGERMPKRLLGDEGVDDVAALLGGGVGFD